VVLVLARPQGEDARATATLAVTVLIATAGFFEASRRSREERRYAAERDRQEHRRAAMRSAGEAFCTAVASVNSALTGLRFSLEPHDHRRSRIEAGMTAVTTSVDELQAATARVEFAFPSAAREDDDGSRDWPSEVPEQHAWLLEDLRRAVEMLDEDADGAGDAVATALQLALISRHAADVLRGTVRLAFAAPDLDADYAGVERVLNGLRGPADAQQDEGGDYPPSLRTCLTRLRRMYVAQAVTALEADPAAPA
jgi:hypothetical protein